MTDPTRCCLTVTQDLPIRIFHGGEECTVKLRKKPKGGGWMLVFEGPRSFKYVGPWAERPEPCTSPRPDGSDSTTTAPSGARGERRIGV